MKIVLKDVFSERLIEIKHAQLPQRCEVCHQQMEDQLIFRVEGYPASWRCINHLEETLMVLDKAQ